METRVRRERSAGGPGRAGPPGSCLDPVGTAPGTVHDHHQRPGDPQDRGMGWSPSTAPGRGPGRSCQRSTDETVAGTPAGSVPGPPCALPGARGHGTGCLGDLLVTALHPQGHPAPTPLRLRLPTLMLGAPAAASLGRLPGGGAITVVRSGMGEQSLESERPPRNPSMLVMSECPSSCSPAPLGRTPTRTPPHPSVKE